MAHLTALLAVVVLNEEMFGSLYADTRQSHWDDRGGGSIGVDGGRNPRVVDVQGMIKMTVRK